MQLVFQVAFSFSLFYRNIILALSGIRHERYLMQFLSEFDVAVVIKHLKLE